MQTPSVLQWPQLLSVVRRWWLIWWVVYADTQCFALATVAQCGAVLVVNLMGSLCRHPVFCIGDSCSVWCGVGS